MKHLSLFDNFNEELDPFTRDLFNLNTTIEFSIDTSGAESAIFATSCEQFFNHLNTHGFNALKTDRKGIFEIEGKINMEDIEKTFPKFIVTSREVTWNVFFKELIIDPDSSTKYHDHDNIGELFWTIRDGFFQKRPLMKPINRIKENEELSDFTKDLFGLTTKIYLDAKIISYDQSPGRKILDSFTTALKKSGLNPNYVGQSIIRSGYYTFEYLIDGKYTADTLEGVFEENNIPNIFSDPIIILEVRCDDVKSKSRFLLFDTEDGEIFRWT